jgi:hypothetical protein
MTKTCRICKKELDISEFPESKIHKGGHRSECTSCRRESARAQRRRYYQKNKAKELARKKIYDEANREKNRQYQAEYRARKKAEKEESEQ